MRPAMLTHVSASLAERDLRFAWLILTGWVGLLACEGMYLVGYLIWWIE